MSEPPRKLVETNDFASYLHLGPSGIAGSIEVKRIATGEPALSFALDAVDAMGFCTVPPGTDIGAIHCLARTLQENYGGKNFVSVPPDLVKAFDAGGFRSYPEKPDGAQYDALMEADAETVRKTAAELADSYNASLALSHRQYSTVTDKETLHGMAGKLSHLLLGNAEFAAHPDKRALYSPAAMQERLAPDNVKAMALVDNKTGKPVAFIRGYDQKGMGMYVSDLVVDKACRNKSLALRMMSEALNAMDRDVKHVFLIAGNGKEAKFYGKRLGFDAVAQARDPVITDAGECMFALFPQREILQSIPEKLERIMVPPSSAVTPAAAQHR